MLEGSPSVALPLAVIEVEQTFGGGNATVGDVFQFGEIDALVLARWALTIDEVKKMIEDGKANPPKKSYRKKKGS